MRPEEVFMEELEDYEPYDPDTHEITEENQSEHDDYFAFAQWSWKSAT